MDIEKNLKDEEDDEAKAYMKNLLKNMEKRFKQNWRMKSPYNCITYLDPRFVDLYCSDEEEFEKVKTDIKFDAIFPRRCCFSEHE